MMFFTTTSRGCPCFSYMAKRKQGSLTAIIAIDARLVPVLLSLIHISHAKANPPRKLTRAEKKQIAEIIRQAKGDGKAHTAQQTIPYIQMYPDGICKVTERKYSKTVAFEDINYQLAQADDKTSHEGFCTVDRQRQKSGK